MRKHEFWVVAALAGLAVTCLPARAEDERGRWSLGLGIGMLSTKDDIRSNAAGLLLGERGIPNDYSDDFIDPTRVDPRQDDLLSRDTEIEERQSYSLSVAYGLTSWLSLQLDVGRYSGNVSNLDTFRINRSWVDANQNGVIEENHIPREDFQTSFHDASVPISAGRLQELPIALSALFRFRKDSPFNPILGAGVGVIFTDFQESDAFADMNSLILNGFQRTQQLNIDSVPLNHQIIQDRYGSPIASTDCTIPAVALGYPGSACTLAQASLDLATQQYENGEIDQGTFDYLKLLYTQTANAEFLPQRPFVTAHVENAFEYHFVGGAEYHFNDHWSAYFLGRYMFTRSNLEIRISDNGNLVTPSPTGDASQRIQFETDQARFRFLSESNCDLIQKQATGCLDEPNLRDSDVIVQGGEINLSGFTLGFGMRYTF